VDVKVFGQLIYTFSSVPAVNSAIWNSTYFLRDALVKDVTANASAIFASAFPGTSTNCHADISSGPTASSNATQTAASSGLVHFNTTPAVTGASINPDVGGVATTPLQGAIAQLVTVLKGQDDPDSVLGIDTGRVCPSNLIPTTGTWAPACDQPQSAFFPKVYVTTGGFDGVAFTGPAANAIASGAFPCPYCYTNAGAVQAWSYNGPNRGKYCTTSKDPSVAAAVQVNAMFLDQESAYAATKSCIAVGVYVQSFGYKNNSVVVPSGSQGSLCMNDDHPLYAGPVINAPVLEVLPTSNKLASRDDYACQSFAVDAFASKPCAPKVVAKGPAAALAQLSTVAGEPWVHASTLYGGSKNCNTKFYFYFFI
jgi:hypothetical protein